MTLAGTRPEATKYVEKYSNEMLATLLLPAGITSEASIRYKDEAKLLDVADDVDYVYVETVLPEKMKYNLESIRKFNFVSDIITMLWTVGAVLVFHKVWHISQFIYIFGRYWNLQFLLAFHRHILNMNFIYSGPGKHFLYIMKMRC